jgi:hypothetical protein
VCDFSEEDRMSIGINDIFTFGRLKGKTFAEAMLLDDGPGYCCWLREQKKAAGQPRAFDNAANLAVDDAIRSSSTLRRKYAIWNTTSTSTDLETVLKEQAVKRAQHEAAEAVAVVERKVVYAEEWGAW